MRATISTITNTRILLIHGVTRRILNLKTRIHGAFSFNGSAMLAFKMHHKDVPIASCMLKTGAFLDYT